MSNKANLEAVVRAESDHTALVPRDKSLFETVRGLGKQGSKYLVPLSHSLSAVLNTYDSDAMADKLLADKKVRERIKESNSSKLTYQDVIAIIDETYKTHRTKLLCAGVADMADRVTSVAFLGLEAVGLAAGAAPGFAQNGFEEALEMLFKVPALWSLRDPQYRSKVHSLLMREAATAAVPVGGDLYDMFTNAYVATVQEIVFGESRAKLLDQLK